MSLTNRAPSRIRTLQAALVIRGLGIRGFNYSQTRKQGKTANGEGNLIYLSLECWFWYSRVQIFQEHNPREKRGKPVFCEGQFHEPNGAKAHGR